MAMFGIGSLNLMCRQSSSVVGKINTSFSFHLLEIISYFHRWKRHIKQLYFKTVQHENPDEFSLKVILISWKFNVNGRLSLPKINLWLWINKRKENIKKTSINAPPYMWIVCFNSSFEPFFKNFTFFVSLFLIKIKFGYNARCHWLKERALWEYRA